MYRGPNQRRVIEGVPILVLEVDAGAHVVDEEAPLVIAPHPRARAEVAVPERLVDVKKIHLHADLVRRQRREAIACDLDVVAQSAVVRGMYRLARLG